MAAEARSFSWHDGSGKRTLSHEGRTPRAWEFYSPSDGVFVFLQASGDRFSTPRRTSHPLRLTRVVIVMMQPMHKGADILP